MFINKRRHILISFSFFNLSFFFFFFFFFCFFLKTNSLSLSLSLSLSWICKFSYCYYDGLCSCYIVDLLFLFVCCCCCCCLSVNLCYHCFIWSQLVLLPIHIGHTLIDPFSTHTPLLLVFFTGMFSSQVKSMSCGKCWNEGEIIHQGLIQ